MHEHNDTNSNAGQPVQPQAEPYPTAWPVPGVEPVAQPKHSKPRGRKAAWIVGGVAAVVALCCAGTTALGLSAGDGEQQRPVKAAPQITAAATTAPASTTPAAAPETTEPEPEPTDEVMGMPLGSTITATTSDGEVEITVSKSTKYPKARKSACDKYMPGPDEGYYLVLDVKVRVVSGTGSINPLFFTFVDADGVTSDGISGAFSGCGKALDSGNDFPTGTKRSGQLVFDVASAKGEVVYDDAASWRVG